MSVSRLSESCAGFDGEFPPLGHIKIEPDHQACEGGHTRPGLLGGWVCSCECHRELAHKDGSAAQESVPAPVERDHAAAPEIPGEPPQSTPSRQEEDR